MRGYDTSMWLVNDLDVDDIDERIKEADAAVILYLHPGGGHYFAVQWNEGEEKFETANVLSSEEELVQRDTMGEILTSERTTLALITINKPVS
jgi:hypothetical protein